MNRELLIKLRAFMVIVYEDLAIEDSPYFDLYKECLGILEDENKRQINQGDLETLKDALNVKD